MAQGVDHRGDIIHAIAIAGPTEKAEATGQRIIAKRTRRVIHRVNGRKYRAGKAAINVDRAKVTGLNSGLPKCRGNSKIQRRRPVNDTALCQWWFSSFGRAGKPDPFVLRHTQIARLPCACQDNRTAQIDRILCHMPATVNIRQRVIGIVITQHRFGRSIAGELRVGPRFRFC